VLCSSLQTAKSIEGPSWLAKQSYSYCIQRIAVPTFSTIRHHLILVTNAEICPAHFLVGAIEQFTTGRQKFVVSGSIQTIYQEKIPTSLHVHHSGSNPTGFPLKQGQTLLEEEEVENADNVVIDDVVVDDVIINDVIVNGSISNDNTHDDDDVGVGCSACHSHSHQKAERWTVLLQQP